MGTRNLVLGVSGWRGKSNFSLPRLTTTVGVAEFDARYRHRRLELRGEFARVGISDAADLNDAIARQGFYGEAAYRVWAAGSPRDLVAFVRYENFDTQHRMPAGFIPLKEFDRDAWVFGLTYYPDPDIAVKADFVQLRNQSNVVKSRNSFNVGLGWWF